ncbi:glycosyltransferase family 39 protein [Streptomyces sp. 142MFCol3.1]|uniref:glycosyltransferase family 39 protein n=1 Tax=Streptomyces sp. 142MFCol3.1 TaxID=1172179 RepID=UPI0006851D92|nr:glycosyltransferase family 39 protein [Streptomyces sp. 142MFCol3.1]
MVGAWLRRVGGGHPEAVAVLLPVLVMTAVGLWGLDRGGMWRDEAVTFQVAQRSVPQIWHLLHTVDAVHGLYYLLMHPVLAVHPGEFVLRLPSVCGAAAAAAGVAALGVRLCRPRVGLWAGLLYAVTPMAGHYAQEGRSYALVAAGAAGATLLLVRAARTRRAGGWWAAYGGTVAVTCLLHELAALALLAHAGTLALARVPARVWSRWACAAGAAVVALAPLVLVSRGQSAQVAWLTPPGPGSVGRLLGAFTGPALPVAVPYLLLVTLAVRPSRLRYGGLSLPAVALPLTVVPPAVLMTVSRAWPLYDERYVLYSLAGAPLLAAAGAERAAALIAGARAGAWVRSRARGRADAGLGSRSATRGARLLGGVRRRPRPRPAGATAVTLTGVLTVALAFAVQLPLMRRDRTPEHHGADNLAAVSAAARRALRPGDPVLYLPSIVRRSALAYPRGFCGVRDVALRVPGPLSGTLYGQEAGPEELRRRLDRLDRVWMVAEPFALSPSWYPHSATERVKLAVVDEEFVPREQVVREGVTLRLYVRRTSPAG